MEMDRHQCFRVLGRFAVIWLAMGVLVLAQVKYYLTAWSVEVGHEKMLENIESSQFLALASISLLVLAIALGQKAQ